jgi:hypothetical protein
VIEGDGTSAEAHQCESEGGKSQRKFVSPVAHQSVVEVHLGYGDAHINTEGKGGHASEQADQNENSAEEFGEGGKISAPGGKPEAGDELNVVVKAAENLVVSVVEKNEAQRQAHDQECEGLQTIEVAQGIPPAERK